MKKLTMLAVTAVTVAGLGGQVLTAQAATEGKWHTIKNGNRVIYAYNLGCNIQDILGELENCFPNISLPGCETPDCEIPEVNDPETDIPEAGTPEIDVPEEEAPEIGLPNDTPDNSGNDSVEDSTPEDGIVTEHAFIKEVVALVNVERAKEGLSPLTINTNVQTAAMVRAKECEQLFSHTRPDGSSFATALKEQNVSYKSAGENIAWGQKTPEEVMNAWMNSAGHRANIMNPNFTTIGVGYYENAKGTDYWCQLFTR